MKAVIVRKGGPGSGYRGHPGLPGVHGGSRPRGSGGGKLAKVKGRIEAAKKKKLVPQPEQEDVIIKWGDGVKESWEEIRPEGSDIDLETFVMNAWGYDDPETGFKSEIRYVHEGFRGIDVTGYIYNPEGEQVGRWQRAIEGEGKIIHAAFKMEEKATGFGRKFYQKSEEVYLAAGIKEVSLHANGSVGGYAWARMGFDFDEPTLSYQKKNISNIQDIVIIEMSKIDGTFVEDGFWEPTPETKAFAETVPDMKPWEMATFEYKGVRVGKKALLGSNWNAVKYLNENDEGFIVGQIYYQEHEK